MPTVIALIDHDEAGYRTDVLVVADRRRKRLLWVPRDLWSFRHQERVNSAYSGGGFDELFDVLAELGVPVDEGIVLPRSSTGQLLSGLRVTVPVDRPLEFRYPDGPVRIEVREKIVRFEPPAEVLEGERIHQWIGARYGVARSRDTGDLARLARQRTFVAALLEQGCDLARALGSVPADRTSNRAGAELRRVNRRWELAWYHTVAATRINDAEVLLPTPPMVDGELVAGPPLISSAVSTALRGK